MRILSRDTKYKIKQWQKNHPDKIKQYRENNKKNKKIIINRSDYVYDNVTNRSLKLSETEIKLKKCYITCLLKDDKCDIIMCKGCPNNIQYRPDVVLEVRHR